MNEEYKEKIVEELNKCENVRLLDFILRLLNKRLEQTSQPHDSPD